MENKLKQIRENAEKVLAGIGTIAELEEFRVEFLGKKGELTAIMREMGGLSAEERPKMGALANTVRTAIEEQMSALKEKLEDEALEAKMQMEKIDVTIGGKRPEIGKIHPLNKVLNEICDIFLSMGFEIAKGPEVELDYYNFEALNIPESHPARDDQDTFYITDHVLLRTQTSPVQIRVMENKQPPIRIIAPGRVYRSDAVDATHSPMFHQIEGLVVDKGVTMGNLKGCLEEVVRRLYGEGVEVRFRPHHFQFTEPSAEMDIKIGDKWVEILGAGMVHRDVLLRCGIDPDVYSGFAFGMGLERIAMRSLGVNDLRLFYENDVRFLEQF
ncbi:phenylalanine--tRNA ligase alpha subunit [Clostridia bacterium]|nr:phenylalanine--tRNA ligase alpha subunit [Clostridia bacterium]